MATVDTVLSRKGYEVVTVPGRATVLEAAKLMNIWRVGAVVVAEQHGAGRRVEGIFTERDMLKRVVVEGRLPGEVLVSAVMTERVICCQPDTTVDEARTIFKTKRIRHLPVLGVDRKLHGLISIGDLNAWAISGQEAEIRYLKEYLYGA
ncbi:MAG: CBS domain-containing protein [Planctomycetota bacterium]